jgi:hypothetical protein
MLDWRDKDLTFEDKDDLLRYVANRWGLPKKVYGTSFTLDPTDIVDWIDLYFLLAEIFMEDRFFAFGLDSLEDSLIELGLHKNLDFSLTILNLPQLETKLGEEYIREFISIFENAGVQVIISDDEPKQISS